MPDNMVVSFDEMLASIPALLGFVPAESFILVAVVDEPGSAKRVGPSQRIDFTDFASLPAATMTHLARGLKDLPVVALIGVVATNTSGATDGLPARDAVDDAILALRREGLPEPELLFLPEFTAGARWSCYQHSGHTGVLPDPALTSAALAATVAGRSVLPSRDDLRRRFTPGPAHDRARLNPLVAQAAHRAAIDDSADNLPALRERLARIDNAIEAVQKGRFPDRDDVIADLIAALSVPRLRDAVIAASSSEARLATEDLAVHLWRLAEEPYAGNLAVLAAVHAYCRGDGAAARIAVDSVTTVTVLVRFLLVSLDMSVLPDKIAEVFDGASRDARVAFDT